MSDELIGSLANPGEFDVLSKLKEDEPFFPLLGRDRLAPDLVDQWAKANRKRALDEFDAGTINEERRNRELSKSTEAEAIGWAMKSFKAGDMAKQLKGEPTAKTYSGHELPEETRQRDELASARNRAASAIQNARAELAAVAEAIEPLKDDPELADLANIVREEISEMKLLAEQVVSWRPIGALQSTPA